MLCDDRESLTPEKAAMQSCRDFVLAAASPASKDVLSPSRPHLFSWHCSALYQSRFNFLSKFKKTSHQPTHILCLMFLKCFASFMMGLDALPVVSAWLYPVTPVRCQVAQLPRARKQRFRQVPVVVTVGVHHHQEGEACQAVSHGLSIFRGGSLS